MRSAGSRRVAGLAVGLCLVALAACARIPTSGPIIAGGPADPDRALHAIVPGPAAGASAREIVAGFLAAALSPENEYAVARSYLVSETAARWRPSEGTVVYAGDYDIAGLPTASATDDPTDDVTDDATDDDQRSELATVSVSRTATIDATGTLNRAAPERHDIDLELTQINGQWRIAQLPDLTLVSDTDLDFVFTRYPVYFLDPTRTYLVGDPRWLPNSDNTASRLVSLLLDGPPAWLRPAVTTAFGQGVRLSGNLSVSGGTVAVDLTSQVRQSSAESRGLMHAQLLMTLRLLPTVQDVLLRAEGASLDVTEVDVPLEPDVGSDPYLLVGGQITQLRGDKAGTLVRNPDLQSRRAEALAISLDEQRYAVVWEGGKQLYLASVRGSDGEVVLTGAGLTAPSFDWRGWVWSTEALTDGDLTVVGPDGRTGKVSAPWLEGRRIDALRVGRSGALVAIASSDASGQSTLQVASVERSEAGRPIALAPADPDPSGAGIVGVRDLAWVGPTELVVVGRRPADEGYRVLAVDLGGSEPTALPAVAGIRHVTAGLGISSALVSISDGGLMSLTGDQWSQVEGASGTSAAAFPG